VTPEQLAQGHPTGALFWSIILLYTKKPMFPSHEDPNAYFNRVLIFAFIGIICIYVPLPPLAGSCFGLCFSNIISMFKSLSRYD
jgi:hypothetical protein